MEEHQDTRMKKSRRNRISFSARLPRDIVLGRGVFADSIICAVKYSTNPFSDIVYSILEMIHCSGGVQDWKQMEELVYCYIVLNPSEVHHVIKDAFLSLLASNFKRMHDDDDRFRA